MKNTLPRQLLSPLQLSKTLFGYQEIEKQLLENFNNNKLHHALLFSGCKGIGKANFAYQLAAKIICDNNADSLKQIESGNHPNLLVIKRETNQKQELKRDITIDSIRKINSFTNLTAANSAYRVIIIDAVDEMNKNSANAVLKALEEPKNNIFFFLINHNSKKIPITIESRCSIIKIKPLIFNQFSQALTQADSNIVQEITQEQLKILFNISNGSVSLALDFYSHHLTELYKNIVGLIYNSNSLGNSSVKPTVKLADLVNKIANKNFPWVIFEQIINLYFSQITKIIFGVETINYIFENEKEYLIVISQALNTKSFFAISDKVNKLLADTKNLNLDKKQTIINILSMLYYRHC